MHSQDVGPLQHCGDVCGDGCGEARIGDSLTVQLRKVTRFGAFGVVEGAIYRQNGTLVATGQIKIWRPSDSELEAMVV